jgi:hypothetical protein
MLQKGSGQTGALGRYDYDEDGYLWFVGRTWQDLGGLSGFPSPERWAGRLPERASLISFQSLSSLELLEAYPGGGALACGRHRSLQRSMRLTPQHDSVS